MALRKDEIEITYYRSRGPGGQHRNVTDSAVRVRHLPTGIVVTATASRSQLRNRQAALRELERRLRLRAQRRKPRLRTRPTSASQERRIEAKKHRATIKRGRGISELE
ncbi:MAG: peptide chain release factor-like protein [Candidatus Hydrogenedentes bacterium]|nr:peptide chain release factor-like protein [Candidatus Hydrogenedentota bacterium]